MRAVLQLELIGDNYYAYKQYAERLNERYERDVYLRGMARPELKPWVARILGPDPKYGFKREFIHGQRDYTFSNSVGSRGIYEYFALTPGIYEVNERLTWKRARRYFVRVEGTEITEISKDEVLECLKSDI
jgi:hypothetical protein